VTGPKNEVIGADSPDGLKKLADLCRFGEKSKNSEMSAHVHPQFLNSAIYSSVAAPAHII
jgi:hypothetical protein